MRSIDSSPSITSKVLPQSPSLLNRSGSKFLTTLVMTVALVALAFFAGMRGAVLGVLALAASGSGLLLYRWSYPSKISKDAFLPPLNHQEPSSKIDKLASPQSKLDEPAQNQPNPQPSSPFAEISWVKNFNADLPNGACWMEVALFQIASEFMHEVEGADPTFTPPEVALLTKVDFSGTIFGIGKKKNADETKEAKGILRKLLLQTLLNIQQSKKHPTLIEVSKELNLDFFGLFASAFLETNIEFGVEQRDSNEALDYMRELMQAGQKENNLRGHVHECVAYELLTDENNSIRDLDFDSTLKSNLLTSQQLEEIENESVSSYAQRIGLLKQKESDLQNEPEAIHYNFPINILDEEILQENIFREVKNEQIYWSITTSDADRGTGYTIPLLRKTAKVIHQPPKRLSINASPKRLDTVRSVSDQKQVTYKNQIKLEKQNITFNPIITCQIETGQLSYKMTSCIVHHQSAKKTEFQNNELNAPSEAGHYYAFFKLDGYWVCMSAGRIAQEPENLHPGGLIPKSPMTDRQFFDYLNGPCQNIDEGFSIYEWRNIKPSYSLIPTST